MVRRGFDKPRADPAGGKNAKLFGRRKEISIKPTGIETQMK